MTWTLTIESARSGLVLSTVTLTEEGNVTTTGKGDDTVPITVFGAKGKPLGPADGLAWLVALGEEMGRSGYLISTIEGPGAPDWG